MRWSGSRGPRRSCWPAGRRRGGVETRRVAISGGADGEARGDVELGREADVGDLETRPQLPKTAQAMRKGKLSGAKADAIADAAAATPDAEDALLEGADAKTLADLREECLRAKAGDR